MIISCLILPLQALPFNYKNINIVDWARLYKSNDEKFYQEVRNTILSQYKSRQDRDYLAKMLHSLMRSNISYVFNAKMTADQLTIMFNDKTINIKPGLSKDSILIGHHKINMRSGEPLQSVHEKIVNAVAVSSSKQGAMTFFISESHASAMGVFLFGAALLVIVPNVITWLEIKSTILTLDKLTTTCNNDRKSIPYKESQVIEYLEDLNYKFDVTNQSRDIISNRDCKQEAKQFQDRSLLSSLNSSYFIDLCRRWRRSLLCIWDYHNENSPAISNISRSNSKPVLEQKESSTTGKKVRVLEK
jgi:hypothetical protein